MAKLTEMIPKWLNEDAVTNKPKEKNKKKNDPKEHIEGLEDVEGLEDYDDDFEEEGEDIGYTVKSQRSWVQF